jgi:hypothetical protein
LSLGSQDALNASAERTAPGIADARGGSTGRPRRCTLRSGAVGKWLVVAASWGVPTTLAEPIPRCLAPRLCRSVNCNDVRTDAGLYDASASRATAQGNRRLPPENAARVRLRKSRGPPRLTAGRTTPLALQQGRRRASVRGRRAEPLRAAHDHGPIPHHRPSRRGTRHQPRSDLHPSSAPRPRWLHDRRPRPVARRTVQRSRSTSSGPTPRPTLGSTRTPTS